MPSKLGPKATHGRFRCANVNHWDASSSVRGYMSRREFITLLGGAAVAWPLATRAQQPGRVRRIGALMAYTESDPEGQSRSRAFEQALKELGWADGENLRIDYRWPGEDVDQIRMFATELVGMAPDAILAGATPAVIALQRATRSIPIVFAGVTDPVGQ